VTPRDFVTLNDEETGVRPNNAHNLMSHRVHPMDAKPMSNTVDIAEETAKPKRSFLSFGKKKESTEEKTALQMVSFRSLVSLILYTRLTVAFILIKMYVIIIYFNISK